MKLFLTALSSLFSLHLHAAIIQQHVIVDEPFVAVRAGQQDNGHVAIEQLFTNNTTSAQDSLTSTNIPLVDSPSFGGTNLRSAPSSFTSFAADTPPAPPSIVLPPVTPPINPPVDPVTPPVPEPETYALMAIGLSGLVLARRQRRNRSAM
ncbi:MULTISPECIES: PEP-CTERM sorting domain-containing protein [Deefgea]|uniref:PEP-CTERM sorting domain-containing protein n=1 Tax=Deefgea chitinilytica TaxID=570276 RepID=A0ABS2CE49_9NEIS|nr:MULTISPECIES: PEP-CTERM sorting domain-containing protein [Deefgea]MBM5572337.1 PEP-CTERM sorting domain-containing protein [Deefgea chitinilytica]MBM9889573.1 PEP-CTERM sorting domain-containing protein [Deefgea sp. CFH1-16]